MLSIVVVVLIAMGLVEYVRRATLASVVESLTTMLASGTPTMGAFDTADQDIGNLQLMVYGMVMLMSAIVGLIVTRLALKPVYKSLVTQRQFIASVAHELRTPLAILKTQNEVSRLEVKQNSPVAEMLEQNVEEIDHITEILNNLLLFNRVDTLESIVFDAVDIKKIIETVVSRLKRLADKKGVLLTFKKVAIPNVYGNATGLEQALFNVVKNSVNYTSRGGEVIIECTSITEHEVTIRVTDNGVGIEKHELPHIFEPFYRTDTVQNISQGTGLGLAIVFEIMKLHNGKIYVQSTVGEGTRFDISVPRTPQDMVVNSRAPEVQLVYDFSGEK